MSHKSRLHYSKKDTQYIKDNYWSMSPSEIAKNIGRTESGVISKAFEMGASKFERAAFSEEDEQFIRDNYRKMLYKDIAKHLGRKPISINKKVSKMGLIKHTKR